MEEVYIVLSVAGGFWLLGLSVALYLLGARVARVEEGQERMGTTMDSVSRELVNLRSALDGLAKAQQVEDLRRAIIGELRPLVADAVELRLPRTRGAAVEFSGSAQITGAVTGEAGQVQTGPIGGAGG